MELFPSMARQLSVVTLRVRAQKQRLCMVLLLWRIPVNIALQMLLFIIRKYLVVLQIELITILYYLTLVVSVSLGDIENTILTWIID